MLSIHCGSVSFLLVYLLSCRISHRVKTFSSVCRSCPLCPTASWFALITSTSSKKIKMKMKKLKSFLCIFKKKSYVRVYVCTQVHMFCVHSCSYVQGRMGVHMNARGGQRLRSGVSSSVVLHSIYRGKVSRGTQISWIQLV